MADDLKQCIGCGHAQLRDPLDKKRDEYVRGMAKHGMACCTRSFMRATFHRFDDTCEQWEAAPPEVAAQRVEWLSAKGKR